MIKNPIAWPNGAKCAVAITFDVDTDSILHANWMEDALEMVCANSWLRFDEVAIPRILDMYRDFGIRQTFFYPGWCMENYPHLVEMILKGDHEIAHHGYLHHRPTSQTKDEEEDALHRGIDVIVKMTGRRPAGYRAPEVVFSQHTADLLASAGIKYDSSLMADEIPYIVKTRSGSFVEIPIGFQMDDFPPYSHNPHIETLTPLMSPDRAMEVFMAEFEAAYKYGGMWISGWHPFLSGRLSRCDRIVQMIEYMQSKGDVWFATMEEIADHFAARVNDGSHAPRTVDLPYYHKPVCTSKVVKI